MAEGELVFGYFSADSMANQAGLDNGRSAPGWLQVKGLSPQSVNLDLRAAGNEGEPLLPRGRLALLDGALVDPAGGRAGAGYVYAERPVNPADWFYPFHFTGDPVMPGSLGVEAILQALQGCALAAGLSCGLRSPRFVLPKGSIPTSWRYRGQITPKNKKMSLEAHITSVERGQGSVLVRAEASLWVDGLRIYEIKDAAVAMVEGYRQA